MTASSKKFTRKDGDMTEILLVHEIHGCNIEVRSHGGFIDSGKRRP